MKKYTVLLLYPDYMNQSGTETYLAHAEGSNVGEAVTDAKKQAGIANDFRNTDGDDPEDFATLAIFEGHLISAAE